VLISEVKTNENKCGNDTFTFSEWNRIKRSDVVEEVVLIRLYHYSQRLKNLRH
jgi:hypothetical protein